MIRILWVDDEYIAGQEQPHANYLWYYYASMQAADFEVDHVSGPDAALKKLPKRHRYDAVLLDIIMPPETTYESADHRGWRLTGVLLAEEIARRHKTLSIIVLTNSKNEHAWQRLRKLKSVIRILSKPDCTPRDLVKVLKETIAEG